MPPNPTFTLLILEHESILCSMILEPFQAIGCGQEPLWNKASSTTLMLRLLVTCMWPLVLVIWCFLYLFYIINRSYFWNYWSTTPFLVYLLFSELLHTGRKTFATLNVGLSWWVSHWIVTLTIFANVMYQHSHRMQLVAEKHYHFTRWINYVILGQTF